MLPPLSSRSSARARHPKPPPPPLDTADWPDDTVVMAASELPPSRLPPRPSIKRVRPPSFDRASRVFASVVPEPPVTQPMLDASRRADASPAPRPYFSPSTAFVSQLEPEPLGVRDTDDVAPVSAGGPPTSRSSAAGIALAVCAASAVAILLLAHAVAPWLAPAAGELALAPVRTARSATASAARSLEVLGPLQGASKRKAPLAGGRR